MRRRVRITVLLAATAAVALVLSGSGAAGALAATCSGQNNASASTTAQERAMLCLVNDARRSRGLDPLAAPGSLVRAAARKSLDILRCDEFSHEACGREFTYWPERFGYGGCLGENIAYGVGRSATPRAIFRLWMNSPGHRRNILGGAYSDIGIGLQTGELEGADGAHVWTQQFGSRDC